MTKLILGFRRKRFQSWTSNALSSQIRISRSFSVERNEIEERERRKNSLWNPPNTITFVRICLSPGLAAAIYYDCKGIALAGCIVAGISDWLDGYVARKYDMKSKLGAFLDPAADKIIIGSLAVGLTLKGLIPYPLTALILTRDVALIGAMVVIRAREKPKGAPFFDADTSNIEITPSVLSKTNTGLQFALLSLTLCSYASGWPVVEHLEPLWWLTGGTTLLSGLGYLDGTGLRRAARARVERARESVAKVKESMAITAKETAAEVKDAVSRNNPFKK